MDTIFLTVLFLAILLSFFWLSRLEDNLREKPSLVLFGCTIFIAMQGVRFYINGNLAWFGYCCFFVGTFITSLACQYYINKNLSLFFKKESQEEKPEFDVEAYMEKNNAIFQSITLISDILREGKDVIVIYSKDLLDELYFQRKIIKNIIKNLKKEIKIVFLFNEENEANKSIREFLGSYKDNKNLFYSQIKQEMPFDFITSYGGYLRLPNRTYTLEDMDAPNPPISSLLYNAIKTLEEEGKLEQANKLKEFVDLNF